MALNSIDIKTLINEQTDFHCSNQFENSQQQMGNKTRLKSVSSALIVCKKQIIWNENQNGWKHCIVKSDDSDVLVGHIYQDENGNSYLTDSIRAIKCVFDDIKNKSELICQLNSTHSERFVALQHYSFVFEDFSFKDHIRSGANMYILVSTTSIIQLDKECSEEIHLLSSTPDKNSATVKRDEEMGESGVGEITKLFEEKLCLKAEQSSVHQIVTILLKVWLRRKNTDQHNAAFIVLCQKSVKENTEADSSHDDHHFLELFNSSLDLSDELCILTFSSRFKHDIHLLPGHTYALTCPEKAFSFTKNAYQSEWFGSGLKVLPGIKVSSDAEIMHCEKSFCMDQLVHSKDFWNSKVTSIQHIISERKIASPFVHAIVVDKFLVTSKTGDDCPTLCLILRDVSCSENVRLYVPACIADSNGILPNTLVLLFNCLCVHSQQNNLYLKASSLFGMQVMCQNYLSTDQEIKAENTLYKKILLHTSNNMSSSFICEGFIMRILSVKVTVSCSECLHEKCSKHNDAMISSQACFQVDDGSCLVSMYCSGDNVKVLLGMSDTEWQAIVIHVTRKDKPLEFCIKEDIKDIQGTAAKIFHLSCTKQTLTRHVLLHCTPCRVAGERNELKTKIICTAISDLQKNVSSELLESFYEMK